MKKRIRRKRITVEEQERRLREGSSVRTMFAIDAETAVELRRLAEGEDRMPGNMLTILLKEAIAAREAK
jgi:hypothetical protein